MSIFIDPNDLFEIKIRVIEINKTKVSILDEDDEQEGSHLIICRVTGRDFDNMSSILENSTIINHMNGDRLIRTSILLKQIILRFFKSWNLLNEKNQIIPITDETVGKMNYSLVRALARKWLKATR